MRVRRVGPLLAAAMAFTLAGPAAAQSPLGIGAAEVVARPEGWFSGLFGAIAVYQQEFFRSLRLALVALKEEPHALAYLAGLSFAYGVFHAAGPGHGKVVISSYMLANEVQLRRGVVLSFASALVQAVSALAVVGAGWFLLRGTALSMTDATVALEVASYAMIAAFGGWLLVRKLTRLLASRRTGLALDFAPRPASRHAFAGASSSPIMPRASGPIEADRCTAEDHGADCGCGRAHMPDPKRLGGERLSLASARSAVVAVGLRPCSGAIVVLTFSLVNGLYLAGILSVLAMAMGTAITVSLLATTAVYGKGLAVRAGGGGKYGAAVGHGIEILGASLLLLLGLALLGGALRM